MRRKTSEYGMQLRAKQTARRYYGVLENQFRHYYELAEKREGKTGEALLKILESRFDNVIYRLGFANSRAQGRQLVTHGHFCINGHRVDIPSYLTKSGDVITLRDKTKNNEYIKAIIEANASRPVPKWLEINKDALEAKVLSLPEREEIDLNIEETLIVELYSK
jgi:small subunit ribosomal protein S4